MIIEHIVQGSQKTSLHDFTISTNQMDIFITSGTYYQAGNVKFATDTETTITITTPLELTNYEIWLTETGIQILQSTETELFSELINPIDRLAWFAVPINCTSLDNIDIHFVRVVE